MATEAEDEADRQQYLVGSYLLSRYDGTHWSKPIELAKLGRSFVVSDHRMVMAGDSLFIIMEHQDEVSSKENPYIDYICVTPKNAISTQFGIERGRNPQVVRMGDVNMVGYLTQRPDSTQDIRLRTVDMGNNPVASTDSYAQLGKRSVGSFKLTATENAASLDDLALIWSQSVLNPQTDKAESWLCAGRFGKSGQQLFVSYPEQVVQIPDDFTPSAFDGYIDQNNLHVVYAFSDIENDGTAVIQKDVQFTNSVRIKDCVIVAANATSADNIPFNLSVQNTGYAPITKITADIGETSVEFTNLNLLPGESANLAGYFAIDTNNYDGQEQMEVTAQFGGMNIALARRRAPSADASSYASAMMAPLVRRTIMPRSQATAARAMRRADTEPIEGTATVTIPVTDLFDSGQPRTKVIRLQAADLPADQQAIIKVVVSSADGAPVADVHPENNHVPVPLYAQDGNTVTLLGDVNRDGQVDAADATTLAMHLVGIALPVFAEEAADANGDGRITVADISAIVSICIR